MSEINIGISKESLQKIIQFLDKVLANEFVIYTKTRNFHWNVSRKNFSELHIFFQNQYEQLAEIKDEVAERVRMLGGNSKGTLNEFLSLTSLVEEPNSYPEADTMILKLKNDHEQIIRELREISSKVEDLNDMGTNDFLIGLMEKHEKMAWMLRSYLI
jgi:starvation-inducible DNA-binding protein